MRLKVLSEVLKEGLNGIKMYFFSTRKDRFGSLHASSNIRTPYTGVKQNVYIAENCGINIGANFICQSGKFVLKKNCSIGPNFTVITFNHLYNKVGQLPETSDWGIVESDNVIVNEDVWIGANVTLCPGTIIGRGCIVAAGSVCVKSREYPPYSIIGGNPARFIKFRLSLDEQIKQEELFYLNSSNRIQTVELENNYKRFINPI